MWHRSLDQGNRGVLLYDGLGTLLKALRPPMDWAGTVETAELSKLHVGESRNDLLLMHYTGAQRAVLVDGVQGRTHEVDLSALPEGITAWESAFEDELLLAGGNEERYSTLHCDASGVDGYAPGDGGDTACDRHDSDFAEPAWTITLPELLRLVQLHHAPEGYAACPEGGTDDGFCL